MTETRCCPHVWAKVDYIANDGQSPPVIAVSAIRASDKTLILSLTNQIIRVSCVLCFDRIRSGYLQGKNVSMES